MCAVRPVIAPQGMPAGVTLSRQSLASWRIGLRPLREHLGVGVEGQDAPDRPALAVVVQRLAGDGDRLGPVGRARGHREHQDLGARAEQGAEVALADAVDVGLVAVVAADRDAAAEVGRRSGSRAKWWSRPNWLSACRAIRSRSRSRWTSSARAVCVEERPRQPPRAVSTRGRPTSFG